MTKTRQSGFADRFAAAVIAMALVTGLAIAAETGREPADASTGIEDAANPPAYILPDASKAPFIEMLFYD